MPDTNYDMRAKNYPVQSKDVVITLKTSAGVKLNVGEFTDMTWRVAPEFDNYRPSGTPIKIKLWTGTTISGTLNRGWVDDAIVKAYAMYLEPEKCVLPDLFTISLETCMKDGPNIFYKTLILENVTLMDYENTGAEGGTYRESIQFEAETYTWL